MHNADPQWIIADSELSAMFPVLREASPNLSKLLVWPVTGNGSAAPAAGNSSDDNTLAALIYTSGSTGEPKGVMLSHANMLAAIRAVNAYLQLTERDIIYSALPLASSYGLYQLLLGLTIGATVVLDRSFAFPARSLALIAAEKATVFAGVPTMFAWLAGTTVLSQYDLSPLRLLTSAAAALPPAHAAALRERLPQARLFVMYGQTECKRISYLDPDELGRKAGSVGRGMPFQQHRVIDEAGAAVAAGETGELIVRGPHVMQGYWRNPEATALKLRSHGSGGELWLHTDDLFRVDTEGFLYFVGRRDDIIKIGGHKVSPTEIENVLCQMPEIAEAAVVGMPDPLWGAAAKAHVVLKTDKSCTAGDVLRFCSPRLQGYMVPKAVVFVAALPKTESGKVKKTLL